MAMQSEGLFLAPDFNACRQPRVAVEVPAVGRDANTLREQPTCLRSLRVLVADDNRDAANSLAKLVQLWGHVVHKAYDGVAALELALAFEPDVLLLDIAMPLLDGCALARQLRQGTCCQDALLIALTGYGDEGHRLLWEGAFDHFLIKPVEPTAVKELLRCAQAKPATPVSRTSHDGKGMKAAMPLVRSASEKVTP
jgi:CheY-like chemotaxis protein